MTLAIILTGIAVVVGGILILRLHAFLALSLGAMVVGLLTPTQSIRDYYFTKHAAVELGSQHVDAGGQRISVDAAELTEIPLTTGDTWPVFVYRPGADSTERPPALILTADGSGGLNGKHAVGAVRPGDRLLTESAWNAAEDDASEIVPARVTNAFGSTCAKIGLLIAMASIIGKCLLDSGAADRIVRSALRLVGEPRAPVAFVASGFLLGVPVFFDTVFYLMIPLGKAMRMRTGRNYLLYVLTIVAGATMAHSLVPPTPGPLLVASELNVDIGVMILAGSVVGFFTVVFGYFYAQFAARTWELPLRESADLTLEQLQQIADRDESELPPLIPSLLPIVLPVVLIGGYTIVRRSGIVLSPAVSSIAMTLGDKNVALIISAVIAMILLVRSRAGSIRELSDVLQPALASGGVIILVTAAGGAFGQVLQQTNVAALIRDLPDMSSVGIVTVAFLITTAIRTAQGSATVAMITAVGVLSGIAGSLSFSPVYLALAIGCGSKPVAWMNDSGFWVITRMSGMTEAEGLKYITPMTTLMGVVGLLVVIAGVVLFPMGG